MSNEQSLLYQRGAMFMRMGRIADAISIFERLIAIYPKEVEFHFILARCYLLAGDFYRGWSEYEWRLKFRKMSPSLPIGTPRWDGQPLNGKTIVVLPEQGLGDMIQFVRYVRHIKARGGKVMLGYRPALKHLLWTCHGVDQVVTVLPPHHVHIPCMSLPLVFQTSLATIPAEVPYLSVPPGFGEKVTAEIARYRNVLRIGLAWAGSSRNHNDCFRSLKLEQLSSLFNIAGIKFFSLQKGEREAELKSAPTGTVIDLAPYIRDFADTAAAIQALDLVISVDTSVAHLAGALAKPVWTLIPYAPDWRWMRDREDSPWYPTMCLFRQPRPGDWASVIRRVAEELKALVGDKYRTA
jgi:ADP-heptose:LPS heptosyltransferase